MVDLSQFVVDGATRPDAITGLQPQFSSSLGAMFAAAPPNVQAALRIGSAYRSPEIQKQLFDAAVAKYGSEDAARHWVAPPGNSVHNRGEAVDLKYNDDAAKTWAHANAGTYGLTFPMPWEPWHVEATGARDGTAVTGDPFGVMAAKANGTLPTASAQPAPNYQAGPTRAAAALMAAGATPQQALAPPVAMPNVAPVPDPGQIASMYAGVPAFSPTSAALVQQQQAVQAQQDQARRAALLNVTAT